MMRKAEGVVHVVKCETAAELLHAIAPTSEHFESARPYSWVFRGVWRSDFRLVPAAPQGGGVEAVHGAEGDDWQIGHEWQVLRAFFELADLRGMPLPEDSQRMRRIVDSVYIDAPGEGGHSEGWWPPTELLSLCGVAQHYGLPTRLLDWTYDPRVAAYFAARGVMMHMPEHTPPIEEAVKRHLAHSDVHWNARQFDADQHGTEKSMAVWALDRALDRAANPSRQGVMRKKRVPYETVTIPYATNPNIQAQQGIFTVVRHEIGTSEIDRRAGTKSSTRA